MCYFPKAIETRPTLHEGVCVSFGGGGVGVGRGGSEFGHDGKKMLIREGWQ